MLITGGAGFIGSNFVHYIFKNHPDYSVTVLDKLTYAANLDNLKDVEALPNYKFVAGDICDIRLVDALVAENDVVVHFAAETHVDRSIEAPAAFIQTNVVGTQTLLDACVKYDRRFHHISTDEVFGFLPLGGLKKFHEYTPYDPSSPYSASKAASDHLVRAYGRTYGLRYTITNCSNNYGKFQHSEKLIPKTILNALKNEKITVYGTGLNVRDWISVWDHCAAVDLVLRKGKIGETYLVGGDSPRSNLEVIRKILEILGKGDELIEFVEDRKGHDPRYELSCKKIKEDLGWSKLFDFETGLRQTVEWYQHLT